MFRLSTVLGIVFLMSASAAAQAPRAQIEPTVKAIRAQYPPAVIGSQIGEILNAIAWQHRPNVKLLKKGGGGNCPAPQGVTISCDILIWAPPGTAAANTEHIDVLSGASADGLAVASPFWKSAGPCTKRPASDPLGGSGCEMKNALDPIAPGDSGGDTDPVPPPAPPTVDLKQVLELLAELRLRVNAVDGRFDIYTIRDVINTLSAIATKQDETQQQIDAVGEQIKAFAFPCFSGSLLGRPVKFCPE